MSEKRDPHQALREHYDFIKEKIPEENIIGIFLYGSQNYGIETASSDVDSRVLYVPTLDEIIHEKTAPMNKEYSFGDNEKICLVDIRNFLHFSATNISWFETLITDYKILNYNYYATAWNLSFGKLEIQKELFYHCKNYLISSAGHMGRKYCDIARRDKSGKSFANALRCYFFNCAVVNNKDIKYCFTLNESKRNILKGFKEMSSEEYLLCKIKEDGLYDCFSYFIDYSDTKPKLSSIESYNFLDGFVKEFFKIAYAKELK